MCKKLLVILFPAISLLAACTTNASRIKEVLLLAGENGKELQKVLAYYSKDPADSLKLRAAEFLIINMPGHRCLYGEDVDSFYREIDTLLPGSLEDRISTLTSLNIIAERYSSVSNAIRNDLEVITAPYLIQNIEKAFEHWLSPSANYLTFDQFCEWLLPYKIKESQRMDNWRDTLAGHFANKLRDTPPNDETYSSPYYKALWINREIREAIKPYIPANLNEYNGYSLSAASSMYRMPFGDCFDYAALSVAALRSHGVPAVLDYLPQWGRGFLRHAWYAFVNDNGAFLPSEWGVDSDPGTVFHPWRPIPKIYRYCYAPDPFRNYYFECSKLKYSGFTPFQKDVTDWYVSTSDPVVPLFKTISEDDFIYIATFNNDRWNIIDIGVRRGKKGYFKKMGRNNAYMAFGYDGTHLVPVSDPFTIEKNGRIRYRIADTTSTVRIRAIRKMPVSDHVARMERRIIGGRIQASDFEDFRNAETLYVIDSAIFPDKVPLHATKPYKFWRFLSADGTFGSLSELQFFQKNCDMPARGQIIGVPGRHPSCDLDKVFDGDWFSTYDGIGPDGNWYGIAFEKPVEIDRVRCAPRTDDNLIHAGDEYELKYWGGNEWKSLGYQVASEKYLQYDQVPSNALLWLSNHTRGYDERIFTFENGKQIWW